MAPHSSTFDVCAGSTDWAKFGLPSTQSHPREASHAKWRPPGHAESGEGSSAMQQYSPVTGYQARYYVDAMGLGYVFITSTGTVGHGGVEFGAGGTMDN